METFSSRTCIFAYNETIGQDNMLTKEEVLKQGSDGRMN